MSTPDGVATLNPAKSESLFDYKTAKDRFDKLITAWKDDVEPIISENRRLRQYVADVKYLREQGVLEPDETYIPVRLIKVAVNRFKTRPLSFINNTRHLMVFESEEGEKHEDDKLAKEFTKGMRYDGWLADHLRLIDSIGLHGLGFMEPNLDVSKPLHYATNFVPYSDVLFPKDTRSDIQNAEFVMRRLIYSVVQLRNITKELGIPEETINKVIQAPRDGTELEDEEEKPQTAGDSTITIWRVYFKNSEGVVYEGYYHCSLEDWLLKPRQFFNGRLEVVEIPSDPQETATFNVTRAQVEEGPAAPPTEEIELPETMYPIFSFPIEVPEDTRLLNIEGLARLVEPQQEAVSTLVSSFVNASRRSSKFIGFPEDSVDAVGAEPQQLEQLIRYGAMYDRKMAFASLPAPDPNMLRGAQFVQQVGAEEQSEIQFTVSNRPDARKTSKELQLAAQKEEQLKSENEAIIVSSYETMYSYIFELIQNRAAADRYQDNPTLTDLAAGRVWNLVFAAKIEIIERERMQQQLRMDLTSIFAQSPAAQEMIVDIIKGTYPDQADRYIQAIAQGQQEQNMVAQLAGILAAAIEEGRFNNIPESDLNQLVTLVQQVTGQQIKPPKEEKQPS